MEHQALALAGLAGGFMATIAKLIVAHFGCCSTVFLSLPEGLQASSKWMGPFTVVRIPQMLTRSVMPHDTGDRPQWSWCGGKALHRAPRSHRLLFLNTALPVLGDQLASCDLQGGARTPALPAWPREQKKKTLRPQTAGFHTCPGSLAPRLALQGTGAGRGLAPQEFGNPGTSPIYKEPTRQLTASTSGYLPLRLLPTRLLLLWLIVFRLLVTPPAIGIQGPHVETLSHAKQLAIAISCFWSSCVEIETYLRR
ncbi:hypothetical protein GWK47_018344 [Chionoecetes opilio]|uniref:Uncharacterized protein n=1 Tax=Chionoecetes opilio TaxID=41210 RepID=A0A8J5CIP3_CHIOP|nr:hypothetical protein GWK47_018344 [Chionoecetes opilio]